jgi:negative regulator of sigma E activity
MTMQANGDCSEAMSRLLDGELEAGACRELFERLDQDSEAQRTWVLLNIASDALRSSETAALHSSGFVTRFSVALATEPVILAPGALRHRYSTLIRVGLPAAAVAAAVLALAVVAVPQLRGPTGVQEPKMAGSEFEARYVGAHRDFAGGPVTPPSDYVLPAAYSSPGPH